MSAKIQIVRQGKAQVLDGQNTPVRVDAQADAVYQLVDENGQAMTQGTTQIRDGDLWIDLPDTAASPDFILNGYAGHFPAPDYGSHTFGHTPPALAEAAASTAKSSGLPTPLVVGALAGVVGIGVLAAGSGRGGDGDSPAPAPAAAPPAPSAPPDTAVPPAPPAPPAPPKPLPSMAKVMHGNKIVVPDTYTYEILKTGSVKRGGDIERAAKAGIQMNQYRPNPENKTVMIEDLNNLSPEIRTELSLFVAGLLNPVREKFNLGKIKVSEGAMKFAQAVADEYQNHNQSIWTLRGNHYKAGIARAAAKFGLNDDNTSNYYENMGGRWVSTDTGKLSLDALKARIHESIRDMLFDDAHSNQSHAKSLLSASGSDTQNAADMYLGVDISVPKGSTQFSMHFISVLDHPAYVKDAAKFNQTFDKTPLKPPVAELVEATVGAEKEAFRSVYETDTLPESAFAPKKAASPAAAESKTALSSVLDSSEEWHSLPAKAPETAAPDNADTHYPVSAHGLNDGLRQDVPHFEVM